MIRVRSVGLWLMALVVGSGVGLLGPTVGSAATSVDADASKRIQESYGKLPLSFEVNQGQAPSDVKFLSRGPGYGLFLTPGGAVLSLTKPSDKRDGEGQAALVGMRLLGAKAKPAIVGLELMPGKSNYLIGNDPAQWHTNVAHYGKVKYEKVYPGIDLIYYGNQQQLEYDFVVAPGSDPRKIAMAFAGIDKLEVDTQGDLVLTTATGVLKQHKPIVYQQANGKRKLIDGRYLIKGAGEVGFQVAQYDKKTPLIIDPVLAYSTYLGSCGASPPGCTAYTDGGASIAVDGDGNAYLTGFTHGFPTTAGALDTICGGPKTNGSYGSWTGLCFNMYWGSDGGGTSYYWSDGFVTKLNPAGTQLIYSTYLGGARTDRGQGIAVDSDGNAYVTGYTHSTNFPVTTGAFDVSCGGCTQYLSDAFIVKLNPAGSGLVYGTFLGGSSTNSSDGGYGIAVDSTGKIYVTGSTSATDFPTVNPFQPALTGGHDGFVSKINPAGTGAADLVYSTYLGGSGADRGHGIAVNGGGNAYVTGYTSSVAFPTISGSFDTVHNGGNDAFVTKLDATGSTLTYSTYVGGTGSDLSYGIAIDAAGNAYVTGTTTSTDFPFTVSGSGSFVTELNAAGSALVFSNSPGGYGIARDCSGNIFAVGGGTDAVVTKRDASGALLYTYSFGGSGNDVGYGIAVDCAGSVFVTGETASTNFPTLTGGFQPAFYGGPSDAFVVKITDDTASGAVNTLTVNKSGNGTGTVTASPAVIDCGTTCVASLASSTVVTLTATPAAGSTFQGWSGGGCSGTGTCVVTMSAVQNVTATFPLQTFALTVSKTGTGTGTVTSSPAGINCGATCSASYTIDTVVMLTATPGAGSAFGGWSGAGCSGTGTCVVTMSAAQGVSATFTLQSYTLTVSKTGSGTGTVTSSPSGISCGATCSASYTYGTVVTLTATPDAGSTFWSWSGGGCSGTGTCVVTVSAATTVTATFIVSGSTPVLLSQGQPATASSYYLSYTPSKAVDGNISTLWSAGGVAPRWIYVDLGSVRGLTEVRVLAGTGGTPVGTTYYNVQVSDDATNWTTVASASNASNTTFTVSPVSASGRYVRIYVTSNSMNRNIVLYEFQAYGF